MSEITEIKTLNGYPLADTKARADIATLSEENAVIRRELEALQNEADSNITKLKINTYTFAQLTTDGLTFRTSGSHARMGMAQPVAIKAGDTLTVNVADGEKYMVFYLKKVAATGDLNSDYELVGYELSTWISESRTVVCNADQYVYAQLAKSDDSAIDAGELKTYAYITQNESDMVDGLPLYWATHLDEKNAEIDTAMNAIGGHGDAVLYFTDPHWSSNQQRTPNIARYIRAHTSIKNVFCGGDIATGGGRDLSGYRDAWNGVTVFTFRGNHDQNPLSSDESDIISDEEYYNLILRPIEDKATLAGQLYFHLDNEAQKIRYIFMDSGCAWTSTLDDVQINWIKERLTELDEGWSALVMQHMVFDGNAKNGDNIALSSRGTLLVNTINAVWDQLKCNIIGILTGHIHSDYSITESVHGYPIIATSCDNGAAARNDYDPVNPSMVGTVSEQLLDAVCIDTSARTIQCIRIGAGSNRTFTY